jgi:high-affinity iron transporter
MGKLRFPYWLIVFAAAVGLGITSVARGADSSSDSRAKQIWQLLDYVAVDYAGAVSNGQVLKESEYAEMREFAGAAQQQLSEMPGAAAHPELTDQATKLKGAVAAKSDAAVVAQLARGLAQSVQKAYPFAVAPAMAPELQRGASLFQAQCAACHGPQGRGDGPLAASLDPKPTALTEHERARQRSLLSIHQIISQGVKGTAMASFGQLSDDDRWALALFVGTLPYSDADRSAGAAVWKSNSRARAAVTGLESITQLSESALAHEVGADQAKGLTAYLRANPKETSAPSGAGTALAKAKLAESVSAVQRGDRTAATKLALSAYLDGFEPIEPALASRDHALFEKIETGMIGYRAQVANGTPEQVQASEQALQKLLDQAQIALAPSADDAVAAFVGSLTILLREGLEALLVVVAMVAFLKKAERKDVLVYVHAGWVVALLAGGATWAMATFLVGVSGASRELTEGFSSLFAAVVLLGVGMWMHQKSIAGRWQVYLKQKLSAALTRRTAWFMFALAFIAVYREVFETVLFYAAMWTDTNGFPLLAGLAAGMAVLGLVAFVLLRTSARLPIGQFFAASSLLVAILAVVLAGKGVAGLQEAGWMHSNPVAIPRIAVLGIFPSMQTLVAQAITLLAVVIGFRLNTRSGGTKPHPKDT